MVSRNKRFKNAWWKPLIPLPKEYEEKYLRKSTRTTKQIKLLQESERR